MSKTLEPQADYTIHVEAPTVAPSTPTTSAATPARKVVIAEVAQVDEKGEKFDVHGIRIGRWESEPCGDDCVNGVVSLLFPCISAAQINHRLGGSYGLVLIFWGVVYCLSVAASTQLASVYSKEKDFYYTTSYGRVYISSSDDQDLLVKKIVWNIVGVICGLAWLVLNVVLRGNVRERWSIPGSCCGDYCCVWWCSCCSLSQLATHTKSFQRNSCNLGPCVDALPGYEEEPTATKA